ncbi:MAG TPA: LPXTG cell wall anchor domain-containing protein [Steroidobacteraceae bacterium]|jgi:LPXTG-motif cell wall-anchored protein
MNTKAIKILSTACLIACASVATAQTDVDRSFNAASKDCSGIQWSEKALATYPTIASACQNVQERNGHTYVKFQGTVSSNKNSGEQLVVNFKDGGKVTLTPPPQTSVYVNGKKTSAAKLQRGDELNFYIAEDRLAAQFPETTEPEVQMTHFTIVPMTVHEDERMASLPSTASDWPMVALGGVLLLGFGGFLSWSGRRR